MDTVIGMRNASDDQFLIRGPCQFDRLSVGRPIRLCRPIAINNIHDIFFENAYIVKNVILQYGAYESWKLSELSHKELSWRNSRIGVTDGYITAVEN